MGLTMKYLIRTCIFLKFSLLILHISEGIVQVNRTVKDKATLPCNYNISSEELARVRIYWQKGDAVVMTIMAGKISWWPNYKNRTFSLTDNLSIVILALRPSDNGTYTCVVQKQDKTSYKLAHLNEVTLFVRADFPVPSITDLGSPSSKTRRISCSTSGGFPEPHLSWWENGEELNATNTTLSQDPDTELYSIHSEMEFSVTTNHSFVCLVKYGHFTVSQKLNWKKNEPEPHHSSKNWTYALIVVCCVIILIIIMYYRPWADAAGPTTSLQLYPELLPARPGLQTPQPIPVPGPTPGTPTLHRAQWGLQWPVSFDL